jgi:VIT1/CCC1 family predicted Fe2+/Mn2+ transporter
MSIETQEPVAPSTTALVGGIVDDMQDLLKQQMQLTRMEITKEIQNAAEAVAYFVIGGAILFFGAFFVGFGLVHLVHWASAAAGSDPAAVPLWVCYMLLGIPLLLTGAVFTWLGSQRLRAVHPLQNPATDALKQNLKWATNRK